MVTNQVITKNKTKLIRIEHQQKFKHREQAIKEANTIAKFIWRLSQKGKLSCKALVCVSEHDIRKAFPVTEQNGNRGRPTKVFKDKFETDKEASKVKPHLHILIISDEANKIAYQIVKNINKRYRKRNLRDFKAVVSRRYPVANEEKYISYVMHQGTAKRFVDCDYKGVLKDFDYESIYESYKPNLF